MGDRLLLCVRYRVQLGHGAPQSEIVLHMLAVDVMIHCHFKYSKITTPFCQLWACGLAGDDAIEFFCFLDTTYPLENLTVSLSAGDNLLLQSVVVYLDDYSKAYKTWTAEEVAAIVADQGEFTFDIPGDSTGAHQVKIVCTDAAGNEQTEEITNFYVTTNLFVRYYNNKPLFFGSIAAVVVIAGVVIALAAGKKKKNDKEK